MRLPEIVEDNDYIQRKTKEKRKLFPLIYGEPDKEHPFYWVDVGGYNGMSFVKHFTFQVNATSGTVKYYDAFTGQVLDPAELEKNTPQKISFWAQFAILLNS